MTKRWAINGRQRLRPANRAVSEVLSYVLVFSIILSAVLIISVSGVSTLENTRNAEQLNNAERAFDVLSDNIGDLYRRGAPSRVTEMSVGDAQLRTDDPTTINVTWVTTTDTNSTEQEIHPIIYEGAEERQLVYVGGAVFRTNRDSGIRLQNPPMVFNNETVLIPLVGMNTKSLQTAGGSTISVRTNYRDAVIPFKNTTSDVQKFTITVDSTEQREALWSSYFEQQSSNFDCTDVGSEIDCEYQLPSGKNIERFYVVYHDILVSLNQ